MKLNRIWEYLFRIEDEPTRRKERLISSFIRTNAFLKLTLQNKILSLGKLITVFRADCGFTPSSLERTLGSLHSELHDQTNATWDALYSEPNFKPAVRKRLEAAKSKKEVLTQYPLQ